MTVRYTMADARATYKERDAWWTVLLVDPVAGRLAVLIANRTSLTPNQLTAAAAAFGATAAGAFLHGSRVALVAGALLFYSSFVIDCIDGKIARLKDTGSIFGAWLDFVLDRAKGAVCAIALMTGQYFQTGRAIFLVLGMVVLFAEMARYLNVTAVRDTFAVIAAKEKATVSSLGNVAAPGTVGRPALRVHDIYRRFRSHLLAHRIRPHLWSGIEFEMFVFVIGPLTGSVMEVTVASTALLLAFEAAVICKLWLVASAADRTLRSRPEVPRQALPPQSEMPGRR